MKIEPQDLEEFKKLYKAEFKKKLTDAEASEMAGNLVSLYELLCEPLPSEREAAKQQALKEEPPPPASSSQP